MHSEVVGSGLLASTFKRSKSENCVFFCSGVSNSLEIRESQFKREESLLLNKIKTESLFVYFSSVLASSHGNKYYQHKRRMENIVVNNCDNYLIVRLPQVAGAVDNGTLLPSFIKKIISNQKLIVYSNAQRCIIDVEHVVDIFDLAYNGGLRNQVLNCCPEYSFSPLELVDVLSRLLETKPIVSENGEMSLQQSILSPCLKQYSHVFGDLNSYLFRVAEKYTPRIIEIINSKNIA